MNVEEEYKRARAKLCNCDEEIIALKDYIKAMEQSIILAQDKLDIFQAGRVKIEQEHLTAYCKFQDFKRGIK